MANVREDSIYKRVADEYRQRIKNGVLLPGAPIPSMHDLAGIHGTSVVTVRKALSLLVHEGLIYSRRKKGTFVMDRDHAVLVKDEIEASHADIRVVYLVYGDEPPIDVLSQDIHLDVLSGIDEVCRQHEVQFRIFTPSEDLKLPDDPYAAFILWAFWNDGMRAIEKWTAEGRRLVTLHNYLPHLEIPNAACDNRTGGYLATEHLLSLGHTRIGIILTGKSNLDIEPEFAARLQGYRTALNNAGLPLQPELVYVHEARWETESSGYEGFRHFMSLDDRPTAVFAGSDFKALGVMRAARDMSIDIPSDVSLIGYDNHQVGQFAVPRLTTVSQDMKMLGQVTASRILSNSYSPLEFLVPPKLIVRDSTTRYNIN